MTSAGDGGERLPVEPGPPPDAPAPDATAPDAAAPDAAAPDATAPDAAAPDAAAPDAAARPALFSLEGRAAPGLYLVGWIASLLGVGILFISFNANVAGAAPWLFLVGLVFLAVGLVGAAGSQAIERSRRPDLAYRGPSPVLAFLLVVVVTFIALIVILAPLSALGVDARSPVTTTLNLAITTLLYVGVVRLLVVGTGALSWREMGVVRPSGPALVDLAAGAVLAVPVLVATLALGGILSRFLSPAPSVLPEAGDAIGLAANLLSAAILAPIGEELFFRGFATTAWARAAGPTAAIVRGAVFFAFAHVVTLMDASFVEGAQRALFSFLALLPVALALGWLYLGRRSLYAAIGLHAAFNAIQVVLLAVASGAS